MTGACDEKEADKDRVCAPPPSPSPPPPPPPIVPTASAIRALDSPSPILPMGIVSSRPPSTPPASPPSPASKEDGDAAAAAFPQAEAGLRLPVKNRCSIRDAAATASPPTNYTRAAKGPPHLLHHIKPAADTHLHVAVENGFAGLYLPDGQRATHTPALMDVLQDQICQRCSAAGADQEQGGLAVLKVKDDSSYCTTEQEVMEQYAINPRGAITTDNQEKVTENDDASQDTIDKNGDDTGADDLDKETEQCASEATMDDCLEHQEVVEQTESDLAVENTVEPIQIRITEKLDAEIIGRKINTTFISGKIVVHFPPELDRNVMFVVDKLSAMDFTANILADRELFKQIPVLKSKRFQQQFELIKWHKKDALFLLPLAVNAHVNEDPYTKKHCKDRTMYFVEITIIPTGMANIENVVVTMPLPRVDHTGVARGTSSHVWKSTGTYSEHDNSIEWRMPLIGVADRRVELIVDAFCHDGWQDPSQFYPIKIDFFYDDSICSKVVMVEGLGDGHKVKFVQETAGRGSYVIHHGQEHARRAAAAAAAETAYQMEPWAGEDDW